MSNLPRDTREKSLLLEEIMSLNTTYGYGGYCLVYQGGELIGGSTVYWYEGEAPHDCSASSGSVGKASPPRHSPARIAQDGTAQNGASIPG